MARRTIAVFAALAALAAPASADEINFAKNDQLCRADNSTLACLIPAPGQSGGYTIKQVANAMSKNIPSVSVQRIIEANGWSGANENTVIPAQYAFRLL